MMPDTFNQGQSQTGQPQPGQTQQQGFPDQISTDANDGLDTDDLDDSIGVQGAADRVSPDTGIAGAADSSFGTSEDIERDAAAIIAGQAGDVTDAPDETQDDPLSRDTGGVFEGKTVFKANELNQAGEDKEYFHPKDGHHFKVPEDAPHHAVTPDVALTPGTKPSVELKK